MITNGDYKRIQNNNYNHLQIILKLFNEDGTDGIGGNNQELKDLLYFKKSDFKSNNITICLNKKYKNLNASEQNKYFYFNNNLYIATIPALHDVLFRTLVFGNGTFMNVHKYRSLSFIFKVKNIIKNKSQ